MTKTYAIARWDPNLQFPLRRVSTFGGWRALHAQMREAGEHDPPQLPNAHTTIELLEIRGDWARYGLRCRSRPVNDTSCGCIWSRWASRSRATDHPGCCPKVPTTRQSAAPAGRVAPVHRPDHGPGA